MKFSGEFLVPADPDTVMRAFADVPRMASMMPGAVIDGQDEDGSWRGGMLVAFGPKKIQFRGKVQVQMDKEARAGTMVGRGAADLRAARVEMRLSFDVKEAADAAPSTSKPQSRVTLNSETILGGVLADFGKAGGQAVARLLMEEFARRLREDLSRGEQAQSLPMQAGGPGNSAVSPTPPAPDALRAEGILWALVRNWFGRLFGKN